MYYKREAKHLLTRYLKAFPAVGLTGPRQSGKSTLLRHLLPHYEYITFDDTKNIALFNDDPETFLALHSQQVIFDEAQFVPELFHALKLSIDNNRHQYGNYILSGSSQFSLIKKITESLAGRIGLMSLLPLSFSEMPRSLNMEAIYQGSYPELVLRDYREAELWYNSYIETYLHRDVRALANIGDLRDFQRFIQLLAARAAQTLDLSSLARAIGVSAPTIKRWISVLEASYIIFLLPPFYQNFGKRIIKSPKIYFYDTGLVAHLTGTRTFEQYDKGPMAGSLFENFIITDILKRIRHHGIQAELFYLRTQDGAEIDLIIDYKNRQEMIEIKKSATLTPRMASHLKKYCQAPNQGLILYQGKAMDITNHIRAMHFGDYLSTPEEC